MMADIGVRLSRELIPTSYIALAGVVTIETC